MSYNVDAMIAAGDIEIIDRIRRFDVDWGKPPLAINYKRLSLVKAPMFYWGMEGVHSINYGYVGSSHDLDVYGTGIVYATGQADPTDNATNFDGKGYAQAQGTLIRDAFMAGYTIVANVKLNNLPGAYARGVVSLMSSTGQTGIADLVIEQSGTTASVLVRLPNGNSVVAAITINLSEWIQLAVVVSPLGAYTGEFIGRKRARGWDAASVTLYVNDQVVAQATKSFVEPSAATVLPTVGALRTSGTVDIVSLFCGSIDEVAVFTSPLNSEHIKRLAEVGSGLAYFEPHLDFDTDVVSSYLSPVKYDQLALNDGASVHWTLDARTQIGGSYYALDALGRTNLRLSGSSATDAGWFSSTATAIHASNKTGDEWGAIRFGGRGQQGVVASGLSLYDASGSVIAPLTYTAFTAEMWYKPGGRSTDIDGIMGNPNADYGFAFSQSGGTNVNVYIQRPSSVGGTIQLRYSTDLVEGSWHHLAFTITASGEATLFINGVAQDTKNLSTGLRVPPTHAMFCVGSDNYGGTFDDSPAFWADEIALYGVALTAEQINNHYLTGVNGPYRRHRLTGGNPDSLGSSYVLGANELAELSGEVDITQYVADYTVDYDLKQMVGTASLTVYEEWGALALTSYLRANTYVIIERRYISQSLSQDSGWQSLGHFLVEGPLGISVQAGRRVYEVAMKTVMKLLTLDFAHGDIAPDKILVRKTELDYRESSVEWTKFKKVHPLILGNYLENWAEYPSVKLWVTNFQNIGDGNKGGVENADEILRIKGAEGSVQVLGGEGAIVIDNDFLNSSISTAGLGSPQKVMAEFYRYARPSDVTQHLVQAIEYDTNTERFNVVLDNGVKDLDGKTLFVRSGNAHGKIFRIRQPWVTTSGMAVPALSFEYAAGSSVVTVDRTGAFAIDFSINDWDGVPCASVTTIANPLVATLTATTRLVKARLAVTGNLTAIPDTAKLVGVEVAYTKRGGLGSAGSWFGSGGSIKDSGIYVSFGGGYQTNLLDRVGEWSLGTWATTNVGGVGQLFGLPTNITWNTAKTWLTSVDFYAGAVVSNIPRAHTYSAAFSAFSVKLIFSDVDTSSPILYLVDLNEYPIQPLYEGLQVGDSVQVGDFNRIEDALRKVAFHASLQCKDPSLPFYYDFEPAPAVLAPAVPPLRPTVFDGVSWLDTTEQILEAAPPNYRVVSMPDGSLKAKSFGFMPGGAPAHVLEGTLDINQDRSDYGVATRIIARGESSDSVNVALHRDFGGTASSRAYVTSGYAASKAYSMGRTVTQADADALWKQVFNGNPKTPVPALSAEWQRDGTFNYYGVILYAYNTLSNVKRWTFEDTDLCALDIGRSSSGTAVQIEAIEFTWFNHFLEGNTLQQSMYVYYMTEDDYEAIYGVPCPDSPESDNAYFPPADAAQWRLLVDEFALNEGVTSISTGDFVGGKPIKVRFLKFRVGQAHYRFPYDKGDEDGRAIAAVTLAEVKVYTSREIVATAELGNVAPLDSAEHKVLATRIRRRTDVIDSNVTLDEYAKVRSAAVSELIERFTDFTPLSLVVFAPTLEIGEIVRVRDPETGVSSDYLVMAVSHARSGVAKTQLMNFALEL